MWPAMCYVEELGRIVVTGGRNVYPAESYDLENNTWMDELPELTQPRFMHSSCSVGPVAYVFCGIDRGH